MNGQYAVMQTTVSRCGVLAAAVVGLWLALALPAWSLAGPAGLEGLTIAALLCAVPGFIVLLVASRFPAGGNEGPIVLGGTALRLVFVLVGTVVIRDSRPQLGMREFVVWLLVFYLSTLLLETLIVVRGSSGPG